MTDFPRTHHQKSKATGLTHIYIDGGDGAPLCGYPIKPAKPDKDDHLIAYCGTCSAVWGHIVWQAEREEVADDRPTHHPPGRHLRDA